MSRALSVPAVPDMILAWQRRFVALKWTFRRRPLGTSPVSSWGWRLDCRVGGQRFPLRLQQHPGSAGEFGLSDQSLDSRELIEERPVTTPGYVEADLKMKEQSLQRLESMPRLCDCDVSRPHVFYLSLRRSDAYEMCLTWDGTRASRRKNWCLKPWTLPERVRQSPLF
jgi:hypothetical protein